MNPTEFLELVKDLNGYTNVVVASKEEALAISTHKWEADGKPSVWVFTETDGNAVVYVDYARGYIALVIGDEVSADKRIICLDNYIALNPEYYGSTGYLHKKV